MKSTKAQRLNQLIGQRRQVLFFGDETVDEVSDAVELVGRPVSELIADMDSGELVSPVAFLTEIINNTQLYSIKERLEAAKLLLPYTNKKMPLETIEHVIEEDKNFTISFGDKDANGSNE